MSISKIKFTTPWTLLMFLVIPFFGTAQQPCEKEQFFQLRTLIEKNFKFLDTSGNAQKNDFMILRVENVTDGTIKFEFMRFNTAFDRSIKALEDSLAKKWKPTSKNFADVYLPLKFLFNDEQVNPYQNVNQAFDIFFQNTKQKKSSCIWLKPVVLIKFNRVP